MFLHVVETIVEYMLHMYVCIFVFFNTAGTQRIFIRSTLFMQLWQETVGDAPTIHLEMV